MRVKVTDLKVGDKVKYCGYEFLIKKSFNIKGAIGMQYFDFYRKSDNRTFTNLNFSNNDTLELLFKVKRDGPNHRLTHIFL